MDTRFYENDHERRPKLVEFGRQLRQARVAARMSIAQFAERAKVSYSTVSRWETDGVPWGAMPEFDRAIKAAFGVEVIVEIRPLVGGKVWEVA